MRETNSIRHLSIARQTTTSRWLTQNLPSLLQVVDTVNYLFRKRWGVNPIYLKDMERTAIEHGRLYFLAPFPLSDTLELIACTMMLPFMSSVMSFKKHDSSLWSMSHPYISDDWHATFKTGEKFLDYVPPNFSKKHAMAQYWFDRINSWRNR